MKKAWLMLIAVMLMAFSLTACDLTGSEDELGEYVYKVGDFTLEVFVDKATVSVGEEIKVSAVFKNLSGRDQWLHHNHSLIGLDIRRLENVGMAFANSSATTFIEKNGEVLVSRHIKMTESGNFVAYAFTSFIVPAKYIFDENGHHVDFCSRQDQEPYPYEVYKIEFFSEFINVTII